MDRVEETLMYLKQMESWLIREMMKNPGNVRLENWRRAIRKTIEIIEGMEEDADD